MRVLIVSDPGLPVPPRHYGGVERIVDGIVRRLRELGFEVALLAHPESTAAADASFRFESARPAVVSQMRSVGRARRGFRPQLLHGFGRTLAFGASLFSGIPKIVSYGRSPTPRSVRLAARIGGRSLHFTGCSEFIAGLGRSAGGDWTAIPNFVELPLLPFVAAVPDDAPLVFLSRIEEIKGTREAIEIARSAGRRLVIAGNVPDDAGSRAYFEQHVEPYVDGRAVEYIGPVDDVAKARLLGGAAALLVPIQWDEPFGLVFAEALACGTPVIACPRGALPEIVVDGEHGFHVTSVSAGAAAVARICEISRHECRRRVEQKFAREIVVDQYVSLYRRVLS